MTNLKAFKMINENSTTSVLMALSDHPTSAVISYHLERYGFIVNTATTTDLLSNTIERIHPDIIIVDEDLPGSLKINDIFTTLKNNKETLQTKIILASHSPIGNNPLINDYISKPFVPSELVKKVKTLSNNKSLTNQNKILKYNDIEMNVSIFRVTRNERHIHLGPNEFKILQCFLELPTSILSREHIMNYVWGHSSNIEPRTIDVHINRLRSALKDSKDNTPLIKTIRSEGYSLNTVAMSKA